MYENISFQSYCWVLGTTSFRVAQMNLRIEEQLLHLNNFMAEVERGGEEWQWRGNNSLQRRFYEYLKQNGALSGTAARPDKDARQKTSGLTTLGLADCNRVITDAGKELLEFVDAGSFDDDNYFLIPADSYIYFKQLLKSSVQVRRGVHVRPYYVLAYLLNEFDYLAYEEFKFLAPLVVDQRSLEIVRGNLQSVRNKEKTFDQVILDTLMGMQNYREALKLWMGNPVSVELLKTVGMNRKSRNYDAVYLPVYEGLKRVFLSGKDTGSDIQELLASVEKLPTSLWWRRLLFGTTRGAEIRKKGVASFAAANPFKGVENEGELKSLFFRYMHLYKARATLDDYFDLNRRYFRLTDTILFKDRMVKFDTIPKAFFKEIGEALLDEMFTASEVLTESLALEDISPLFEVSEQGLLDSLSSEYGLEVASLSAAQNVIGNERYERLHELLDTRFTRKAFSELLDCFIERDDARIQELVTEDATPSTIFEYVLALIWYEFSGRRGDVLNFMKLSLEADLLPRTHAVGGGADIIFEFDETRRYPRHDMLIEATLADGTNARRMEMEPVSRHLGTHVLGTGNEKDYCVFVAPEIDINVANDFRSRKAAGFWSKDGEHVPLKIIPIDIRQVKGLVENSSSYANLYAAFEEAYVSDRLNPLEWKDEIESLLESTSNGKGAGVDPAHGVFDLVAVQASEEQREIR